MGLDKIPTPEDGDALINAVATHAGITIEQARLAIIAVEEHTGVLLLPIAFG